MKVDSALIRSAAAAGRQPIIRRFAVGWIAAAALASASLAQHDLGEGALQAFESVSVLPSHPANGPILSISPETGVFSARGVSLKRLVAFAYGVDPARVVGGPGWVGSTYYEIEATPSVTTRNAVDDIRPLVRGLLFDHFGLVANEEQAPLYILETAPAGPTLAVSAERAAVERIRQDEPGRFTGKRVGVSDLVAVLGQHLARPVLDRTGLAARYDVQLHWDPDPGNIDALTSALRELGLILRSVPIEQVVIDEARPLPPELGRGRVFTPR